ncbi:MAG: hypothetical protein KCHDKBKB_01334 [Elusimicrobia bacterium]|nr:hypothetical protein [Elusimicrobiota bacterium]
MMKFSALCLSGLLLFPAFPNGAAEPQPTEERLLQMEKRIEQLEAEQSRGRSKTSNPMGNYTPRRGFQVADTPSGDLNIRLFAYVRYLNQKSLDNSYTDSFGTTSPVQQRQDIMFQKTVVYFLGWFLDPKFRYLTYVWTSNTSQGQGAQVVVAGKVMYKFNDYFTFGGGTDSLPGARSTEGNFPYWLGVDNRLISDEYFRPSYTMGVFANGKVVDRLAYSVMLGNNLSQLGVDAGQLDNGLNTISSALIWMPTTGEFGTGSGFGDFQNHKKLASRIGVHYTQSDENFQGQPNTDAFENVQIRLSDGNSIFEPNLFGPGVRVTDALYHMSSLDAGLKYHGFTLEGETYWRWIDDLRGSGTSGIGQLKDTGFQLQGSAMLMPQVLQLYASGSKVFGQYGDPWDTRLGINWYPWKKEEMRWNFEYIELYKSPVGGASLPYVVGGTGPVFHSNFMITF